MADGIHNQLTNAGIEAIEIGGGVERTYRDMPILKALLLTGKVTEAPAESKQIRDDTREGPFGALDVIEPPFNPSLWCQVPEQNTRLASAIDIWARNTVGLGWRIVAQDPEGNLVENEEIDRLGIKAKFDMERTQLQSVFQFPNRRAPFTRVMYRVKWDEEATGNGYLEIVRNIRGRIVGLYHIPAHTMRVRRGGMGYVQLPELVASSVSSSFDSVMRGGGARKRFFKEFGDPRIIHADEGIKATERLGFRHRASEIIHFTIPTSKSMHYGAPRYVSTAPAIAGNRLSAERNVNFFDNDAVPRGIVFVSGGRLDPESVQRIKDFISTGAKGVENAGRLLVLQLEPKRSGIGEETTASMHFQPLTVGVTEDASFMSYRASNDEEVREAFGLSEAYFRVDLVNRSSAEVSKALTEEQHLEPDRRDKEFLLNHTVVLDPGWDGGKMEVAKLQFRRPQIADPVEKAGMNTLYAASGALTPNDLRRELGKDPYPEEMGFGDKPLPIVLAEFQAGVVGFNGKELLLPPPAEGDGDEIPVVKAKNQLSSQSELTRLAEEIRRDLKETQRSQSGRRPDKDRRRTTRASVWGY